MTEQKHIRIEKNPIGAAFLAGLCPGVGYFYLGLVLKGCAIIALFAALIVMISQSENSDAAPFLGIAIGGLYFFQIIDSFNEAKKYRFKDIDMKTGELEEELPSLESAVILVVIGVLFQLSTLDIIRFRDVVKFWPLVLILIGGKMIYNYNKVSEARKQIGPDSGVNPAAESQDSKNFRSLNGGENE